MTSAPPKAKNDLRATHPSGAGEQAVSFIHRRWTALLAMFVVCAGVLLYFARDIKVDNALQIWFIEGDPVLQQWDDFKHQFGNDEFVIIGVTDPDGVYEPASLERIRTASEKLEEHSKVRRVTSVGISRHIDGDAFEIVTQPLIDEGEITEDTAKLVRERVALNPIFQQTIVTDNDAMTLMVVELETIENLDAERPQLLKELRAIADAELSKDKGDYHMSGMGVVYEGLNAATLRDSAVFMSLSYLVVFIGLWILFRRVVWVAVGAGIITLASLLTIGICGSAGRDLNMVTAIVPTLLMVVGILDLVHFVDAYDEAGLKRGGSRKLLYTTIAAVAIPCAFNSLTDIAGFMSLSAAPMSAIRDFGWLTGVGLALLYLVLMICVIPALARYGARKQPAARSAEPASHNRLTRVADSLHGFVTRQRGWILAGTVAVLAVSGWGISKLHIDTYTIGFLHEDDPVRRDHDAIEDGFGKFVPYEFLITAPEAGGIKDPELLRKIEKVERAMEQHPRVDRVTGVTEIIKRLNQVVFDGEADEHRIPDTREAVAQELLLYENDERNDLDLLVDNDYRVARITARSGMPAVGEVGEIIDDLEASAREILGDSATIEGVGYMAVYVRVIENIAVTQVRTFGIALLIITLALMLFLRSIRLGLIALVPNLLPVAMTLGFMGFAGINLDVATVLIAAIVIGIAVNDTTHLMFRFREELVDNGHGPVEALRHTLRGTGRAVIASSLILAAGFSVLAFASVKSIGYFGLLCMVATLFALAADLVVTPALLLTARFKAPQAARLGRLGADEAANKSE